MKLVIVIPAYNEVATVGEVIRAIPDQITGVTEMKILVVDDGSTDLTSQKARKAGAVVIRHRGQRGLAKTFTTGLNWALSQETDLIINLDADGQYDPGEIPKLIVPILKNEADLVVGDRQITKLEHMSLSKKLANTIGTRVIQLLSTQKVSDASSGFRAFTAEVGQNLQILSDHTYTHEMLIQAAHKKFKILSVPITFRPRKSGQSRLIDSFLGHIKKSLATILRTALMHEPFKTFLYLGSLVILVGIALVGRFLIYFLSGQGSGHIQSLLLAAILIIVGFNTIIMGFLADLISRNRQLLEELLKRR